MSVYSSLNQLDMETDLFRNLELNGICISTPTGLTYIEVPVSRTIRTRKIANHFEVVMRNTSELFTLYSSSSIDACHEYEMLVRAVFKAYAQKHAGKFLSAQAVLKAFLGRKDE